MQYTFTKISGKAAAKGQWWNRKLIGEYVPEVDLETLQGVYRQFGWKMANNIVKPKSKVQSPKVKTQRTWADPIITRLA